MNPIAIASIAAAVGFTVPQLLEALMGYKGQKAQLGFQEKQLSTQKQGMAQYIDYLKASAETDYARTLGLKREDRANNREDMLLAAFMGSKQQQTAMAMQMLQNVMTSSRMPPQQPLDNYAPPNSLVGLLR